ncbi:deoxynucleoside kinase [Chitinimonas taiwanensis]|jgi:deoxyadenosine/deoxycytidine kinase|uniref:Deoxyadenosine/deoxycytidine kinase n=1 Tax=Chitinimonas taiwanensis DSM 18899 TaxID=1121279 RepID=A0A1K2HGC9_9NEIS|nr:deoxynucleoside kinase [Chitinimonas taiwanensis]SFZ75787.1 Deoxyadenosine/deoxycytidine kinase [Chitinimonas taiwanensis DSM 18899]
MGLARYRYIVVEGPIGVGKTTLARKLGEHLEANLLLEKPDDIPFLPKFYQDMSRYALPTQLSFLFQRVEQVESLTQMDLFGGQTVADFVFDKDPLFAQLILSDDEFRLYSDIYRHLRVRAPTPDLVIYLQADIDTLVERVRSRSRDYESRMSESYLRQLAERYSRFFYDYTDAPLLIVNTEHLNLVENEDDFRLLLRRIEGMRGAREYFNKA